MKNYNTLDGMINNMKDTFMVVYDKGYGHGYEDGKEFECKRIKGYTENAEKNGYKQGVEKGREEAWNAAKAIFKGVIAGTSINEDTRKNIFGHRYPVEIFEKLSASEAIKKIREYEDSQKCLECAHNGNVEICDGCLDNDSFLDNQMPEEVKPHTTEVACFL